MFDNLRKMSFLETLAIIAMVLLAIHSREARSNGLSWHHPHYVRVPWVVSAYPVCWLPCPVLYVGGPVLYTTPLSLPPLIVYTPPPVVIREVVRVPMSPAIRMDTQIWLKERAATRRKDIGR